MRVQPVVATSGNDVAALVFHIDVNVARRGSGTPIAKDAKAIAAAALTASLLVAVHPCVIAAGTESANVFEDAMRMIGDQGPAAAILGVAAIFLETEAAVVAPEDVDAAIAFCVLPAGQDDPCAAHGAA